MIVPLDTAPSRCNELSIAPTRSRLLEQASLNGISSEVKCAFSSFIAFQKKPNKNADIQLSKQKTTLEIIVILSQIYCLP